MLDLSRLADAVRYEGGVSRRLFLAYGAALSSIPYTTQSTLAGTKPKFSDDPFTLGVASGDPDSRGFVLWTRLAPKPLEPYGGMPATPVEVEWVVAEDETLKTVVAKGASTAMPQLGHSVHVELNNLKPDRWYWYQFRSGDAASPVGRTRTLPGPNVMPAQLKFAFASCQNYEQGYFTAYEQMAKDDVDLVFHLGDYIYEYESGRNGKIRTHLGKEIESLGDYRVRHCQYRTDPLLSHMHAQCPWFVTWDDHEFDNNCAGAISEELDVDPVEYLVRRANAYQAYYEMMPLRRRSLPQGPDMKLYRKASFGRLAELMVLDTRQYRSDQPNNDRHSPLNEAALGKSNTLLGSKQRGWLQRSLITSRGQWNVLAQQVMMGLVGFDRNGVSPAYSMDQWPGYAAERRQLLKFLADRRVPNPVVLTGDIHSNWVNELRLDDRLADEPVVATEFVGTSISSGGNGQNKPKDHDQMLANNPSLKFYNRERGYVRCTVTPESWISDYMVVDDVETQGGEVTKRASFTVEAGDPTVKPG
ncbi:alkaline phosphatase D family protein [Thalassoroseus pseudoceratinae]|uniref:alkaline phosphatase D family protein n=1 Tax=Thalassoroseus pseudoceratinae TaxID=2713176 RepID=UPI00141D9300|nr:alkaline phosphatase D family protein [Thalassoroseus pseudoceratinae]